MQACGGLVKSVDGCKGCKGEQRTCLGFNSGYMPL